MGIKHHDSGRVREKHEEEYSTVSQLFIEKLDVDEEVADILVKEGFSSLEEIAYVPNEELNQMDIFDEDTIEELRSRAKAAILTAIANEEKVPEAQEDLLTMEGMDQNSKPFLHLRELFQWRILQN